MSMTQSWTDRVDEFCTRMKLRMPILLAPMAGACPVSLSGAIADEGGLGACGVLLMQPSEIIRWATAFRLHSNGGFQMNNWIPDPPPIHNAEQETKIKAFIARWHSNSDSTQPPSELPDFEEQCKAMLTAQPTAISSIMGVYPAAFVEQMKAADIIWLATVTTVEEASQAAHLGADAIIAQGFEAGGHRGTFVAEQAQHSAAGLVSLLPAIVDTVNVPVIAAGGIADSRGVAAAITLGASAVQIGTGFLRSPQAALPSTWSDAIGLATPSQTILTRAFTGRWGRSIATEYAKAAESVDAPEPLPYPIQRQLTANMTAQSRRNNNLAGMQAWSGQSGYLAASIPAGELINQIWDGARQLLP